MTKHRSTNEKSSDTESNSAEQENVDELVNSDFRHKQKGKILNKKIEINAKVSKSKSSHIRNETRQRGAAASPTQSSWEESNFNYSPESKKQFKSSEDSPPSSGVWKLLGGLISVLFIIYCLMCGSSPTKQFDVASIMTTLKSDFADQPKMTFRIIKAALSRVSVEDPSAPAILILISSREAKSIRDSFSSQLAKSISQSSDFVSIENNLLKMSGEMKIEIDSNIKNNLTQNSIKAVLVKNLDQIPFEAAMIFHSYCDHENAPFKKVVYVMTMTSDEIIRPNSEPRDWDALAAKRLNNLWQDGNENQVSSLISRLTVSVCAIVTKT